MLPPLDDDDDDDGVDASRKFIVLDPVERNAATKDADVDETRLTHVTRTLGADGGPMGSRETAVAGGGPIIGREMMEFSPAAEEAKTKGFHHQKPESALTQLQKNFKNVFKEVLTFF